MVVVYAPRLLTGDRLASVLEVTAARIHGVAGGRQRDQFVI
jgi:hypothetical protein